MSIEMNEAQIYYICRFLVWLDGFDLCSIYRDSTCGRCDNHTNLSESTTNCDFGDLIFDPYHVKFTEHYLKLQWSVV